MTALLSAAIAAVPLTVLCHFLAGVRRELRTQRGSR